ncbi:MAG: hypothetical protein AAGK17_09260 [Pseudomonadota bacterium]
MLPLLLSLILVEAQPEESAFEEERIQAEMAVRSCGIDSFMDAHDDAIQLGIKALVLQISTADDEQLQCLASVEVDSEFQIAFADHGPGSELQARYLNQLVQLQKPKLSQEAKEWFASRPQYGHPPVLTNSELAPEKVIASIETFCGSAATGALVYTNEAYTLAREWQSELDLLDENSVDTIECIFSAAMLNQLPFGFIGNEKLEAAAPEGDDSSGE